MPEESKSAPKVWHERWWFRHLFLVAVITIGIEGIPHAVPGLAGSPVATRFESATYDRRLISRPRRRVSDSIVFCDIDDESLRVYGRWPWPRSHIAEVLHLLDRARARSILLDIEFPEPSRATLERDADGRLLVSGLRERLRGLSGHLDELGSRAWTGIATGELVMGIRGTTTELVRQEAALGELEQAIADPDLELEQALERTRRVHGVAALEEASQLDRMEQFLDRHPGAELEELPQELKEHPTPALLLGLARLKRRLRTEWDVSVEDAAARAELEADEVRKWIETLRADLLREALRFSLDERPDSTQEEHAAVVLGRLGVTDAAPYRRQLVSMLEAERSRRRIVARWGSQEHDLGGGLRLQSSTGMIPPILRLADDFATVSFSNRVNDVDGVVRRAALLWTAQGRVLRSPTLNLVMDYLEADPRSLRVVEGPLLQFTDAQDRTWSVPVDPSGNMLINWAGKWKSFPHVSVAGFRYAIELERKYLELLGELDTTGYSVKIREALDGCQPWRRGSTPGEDGRPALGTARSATATDVLTWEAEIYRAARSGLEVLDSMIARAGGDPADPRQKRRQETRARRAELIEAALRARALVVDRFELVESIVAERICLVGAASVGLTDLIATPYQSVYPGVGMHGNLIDTILTGQFIVPVRPLERVALTAMLVLVSGLIIGQASLMAGLILGAVIPAAHWVVASSLLATHGLWVPVVAPSVAVAANAIVLLAVRYFSELRQRNEAERMFGYYLSPEVIRQLKQDPSRLKRGGEEVEITALFTDLAGFSTVSEQMTPTEVVEMINDYLGDCTEVLMAYQGTLERYEGDAIRAMFGAPIMTRNHAVQACLAGLEMQNAVRGLREKHRAANRPEFKMRLGLNTGLAVVGNIGARNRFNFTMQGDSVNLAARLEGTNKTYGTQMIIGETTYMRAREAIEARELDLVRVAGRASVVRIYELICKKGQLDEVQTRVVDTFLRGLTLYRQRMWDAAAACFEQADALAKPDPPSQIYLQRCREFAAFPPPPDWDGVTNVKK